MYAVDRVNLERARVEREHEGAEHALVLVGVRFTGDPEVLDDRRVLDVVPLLRRRERILTTLDCVAEFGELIHRRNVSVFHAEPALVL